MTYTLRHFLRHWRLNLILLLGLILAAGLLAGLPAYAVGISAQTLKNQLALQPAPGRNIEISGEQQAMTGALYAQAARALGDLVTMRVEFSTAGLTAQRDPLQAVDGGSRLIPQLLNVWSLDRQRDLMQLVEGQWPKYEPPHTDEEKRQAMFTTPPIEAAIPRLAAEQTGIRVGDQVLAEEKLIFNIVGVLEPLDPQADVWWGDTSLFTLLVMPGLNEDTISLPLVVDPFAMPNVLPMHSLTWRLIIDQLQITPDNAEAIENKIQGLNSLLTSRDTKMSSNLAGILLATRENLATLHMVLLLLGVQAYLFVLYSLALVTNAGMESLQSEMSVLAGRGASTVQILSTYVLEGLVMALLAGVWLGPLVAQGFLLAWGRLAGLSLPSELPASARLLGLAGALCGWLVLCLAAYPAARRSLLEWQAQRARPDQLAAWQKGGIDLFLLLIGGLAYWQLSSAGSFVLVRLRQSDLADPLLLLGPTLFMLAMVIVVLRLFPHLLAGVAWLASRRRGLVLQLGLSRLARHPVRPAQVILLISLAAGLALFTSSYTNSLELAESALAKYRAGADLRAYPGNRPLQDFLALPGVLVASPVQRIPVPAGDGNTINLLAVEPATLPLVTSYPLGMTNLTIPDVMSALAPKGPSPEADSSTLNPYIDSRNKNNPISAVFSSSALSKDQGIGSVVQLLFPGLRLDVSVQGILRNFPTGYGDFILLDRAALAQYLNLEAAQFTRYKEVWLSIDPGFHDYLVRIPWLAQAMRADAQDELLALQSNAFVLGMSRAFALNSVIVSMLSVVGLFLVHYFTARQRTYEFGVLRAAGLTGGQLLLLLAGESLIAALIGLAAGTLLGIGLAQGMRAYLNLLLGRVEAGLVLYQVHVDWLAVLRQYGLLVGSYLLATLLSLGMLLLAGVHRVLRIGDE